MKNLILAPLFGLALCVGAIPLASAAPVSDTMFNPNYLRTVDCETTSVGNIFLYQDCNGYNRDRSPVEWNYWHNDRDSRSHFRHTERRYNSRGYDNEGQYQNRGYDPYYNEGYHHRSH